MPSPLGTGMTVARLAVREIRNSRRFCAFFVFNLALGFFGFLALDAFKGSIEASLAAQSRQLLGADVSVSARRPISEPERRAIRESLPGAQLAESIELYSMVAGPSGSRLVEILASDPGYPFYGSIEREGSSPLNAGEVWVQKDLAAALSVNEGDRLRIGEASFRVSDVVTRDSAGSSRGFSLASRAYLRLDQLVAAGLVRRGTTASYRILIRLPEGQEAETVARALDQRLSDPGVRVRSHLQASQMVGRLQGFLTDYLGLAALASLFLASIGAAYLFRTFLQRRVKDIAVLVSLGLAPVRARRVYVLQLLMLGIAAAGLAGAAVALLLPALIGWLGAFLSVSVEPALSLPRLMLALGFGGAASLLICLPFLWRLRSLNPSALFQEDARPELEATAGGVWLALPALLVFWGLSVWQSQSWTNGSAFVGLFLGAAVSLALVAAALTWFIERSPIEHQLPLRLALRQLSRNRVSSLAGFMAIGLGTTLLNLIPQIQKSLALEFEAPQVSEVPGLFIFDIQPEQVKPLETYLRGEGLALQALSPLVRARLTAVNAKPWEKELETGQFRTREEENETRFRNRGMNLTWRATLSESEKIVEGKDFSAPSPDDALASSPSPQMGEGRIPKISVEQRFAKRLGLKLGDVMTFDVQGVPVEGQIVNLRSVKWTSFQPNFFVQFEPGVLEDAPATWIASIGKTGADAKVRIQNGMVERFANISIIDVSQVVEKILSIFTQMGWAIRAMAALSLFAGFVVLFSIASHQAAARRQDVNLMKVFGAPFALIRRIFLWEFGGLGMLAAGAGALVSLVMSYALSALLFERIWVFDWATPAGLAVLVTLVSVLIARLTLEHTLREKPAVLLQSDL